ncbi:MAG TPA: hypothetical protein RMH85_18370 [Polyangiaceae bacterium LLY-WYZ-15_(1-7)]|nr:hypothetical protein [Myxococcales bacterium]MAT24283.1 hypothetical protein [Sandaracinus sp.]HJK94107.1 hypothetical protein [Polyangiaceae bacterium LLY-WYZ-15_(1-7)]MBJ74531.1 hypothetical protein [Sandaracinus sp.]HJL04253.1 hypothetical protein [Polyangiaceae bacterium LLY-WYZ-15_(1-7)]
MRALAPTALLLLAGLLACSDPPAADPATADPPEPPTAERPPSSDPVAPPQGEDTGGDETEARPPSPYACRVPAIPIPRPRECVRGRSYPDCKWQMPHATLGGGRYRRWRNTIMEHWWARPATVSWVLASVDAYHEVYPEQVVAVGDLDAPGPRHQTHDKGVDVDLYLLGAMLKENAGGGRYPSNFEGKSEDEIEGLRQRVETLARVLATCANGQLRIYYNDEVVRDRFHAWYDAQGFPENPFGRPMQRHNELHDFHFHVSVPEDLPRLPAEPLAEGERHPIAPIEPPPPPESAPHLSSMSRRPADLGAFERLRGSAEGAATESAENAGHSTEDSPSAMSESSPSAPVAPAPAGASSDPTPSARPSTPSMAAPAPPGMVLPAMEAAAMASPASPAGAPAPTSP